MPAIGAPSSADGLVGFLDRVPLAAGVRALAAVPASARRQTGTGSYRWRGAPGDPMGRPTEQQIVSLVRERDVLRWYIGTPISRTPAQRAGGRAALPEGHVVKQFAFEALEGSKITAALVEVDRRLTPDAAYAGSNGGGLRRWTKGKLVPFPDPQKAAGKKVLLFVHGTFSNSEALLTEGLAANDNRGGRKLLADAERDHDLILAYDHPTLSVSPSLNGFDLAAVLRPAPKQIDIVCHSRGGLVTRWFCEAFGDPSTSMRVVFVGSPLAGTSLASAARLRGTFDLLTNVADVLRTASDLAAWATPLLVGVSGVLRVVTSITKTLGSTPLFDAALAMVPGLNAQSRDGNNEEIRRLRGNTGGADFASGRLRYFAIRADFEPRDPKWNFLKYFSRPLQRLTDYGADLVFQGQNDLVVDTGSMDEVADQRTIGIAHDFGTTEEVRHLNYFRRAETVDAIRRSFGIP